MKREIHGNIGGIRDIVLNEMLLLYDIEMSADEFLSDEVCDALVQFTSIINREVLIYVSRVGKIEDVRVGDDHSVHMEEMRLVRNIDRLSGVRCIHTHPNETGYLSDVDLGSLNALRLDAMCAIGVKEGKASSVYAAFIGDMEGEERIPVWYGPMRAHHLPQKQLMDAILEADKRLLSDTYNIVEIKPDRAVLAGIESADGYDTLSELAELCQTAGIKVVAKEQQRRRAVDAATYIGSGKAEELALTASACEADIFVFDDELTAIQLRNLEQVLGLPIIDRTMLILDIFAQRAQSREGKLQVELAQLKYRLPRLLGMARCCPGRVPPASACAARAKKSWRSTAAESAGAFLNSSRSSRRSKSSAAYAGQSVRRTRFPSWRWWATPTRANRRSSICFPARMHWRRTSCLRRLIPSCVKSRCRTAPSAYFPTRSVSSTSCRTI